METEKHLGRVIFWLFFIAAVLPGGCAAYFTKDVVYGFWDLGIWSALYVGGICLALFFGFKATEACFTTMPIEDYALKNKKLASLALFSILLDAAVILYLVVILTALAKI